MPATEQQILAVAKIIEDVNFPDGITGIEEIGSDGKTISGVALSGDIKVGYSLTNEPDGIRTWIISDPKGELKDGEPQRDRGDLAGNTDDYIEQIVIGIISSHFTDPISNIETVELEPSAPPDAPEVNFRFTSDGRAFDGVLSGELISYALTTTFAQSTIERQCKGDSYPCGEQCQGGDRPCMLGLGARDQKQFKALLEMLGSDREIVVSETAGSQPQATAGDRSEE